jgi:hypothetical protein
MQEGLVMSTLFCILTTYKNKSYEHRKFKHTGIRNTKNLA